MISVITPTGRDPSARDLVAKALKRQTFRDFEWIIVSPSFNPDNDGSWPAGATRSQSPVVELADPPKADGDVWSLNKAYNKAIKAAKGQLIVSWQDFTYSDPTTLERFWFHYQNEPNTLISAVGNKYADDSFTVVTWKDPRERSDQGAFYPCYFNDIEWNLCAVPKAALEAVGGFDEELDRFFGMDGYSVLDRLNMLGGWDFKLDQTIKSYSLEHGRPERWEELNAIHGPYEERRKSYLANPSLGYL